MIVPSPKSHLKLASFSQSGLSPIVELFVNKIAVFEQFSIVVSNFDTEGIKTFMFEIVNLVFPQEFLTFKYAINWPFGFEQLPFVYEWGVKNLLELAGFVGL